MPPRRPRPRVESSPCFVCNNTNKAITSRRICSSVSEFTSTPLAECLGQTLDDNFVVVISEKDQICDMCYNLVNMRDRLTKLLADTMRSKYLDTADDDAAAGPSVSDAEEATDDGVPDAGTSAQTEQVDTEDDDWAPPESARKGSVRSTKSRSAKVQEDQTPKPKAKRTPKKTPSRKVEKQKATSVPPPVKHVVEHAFKCPMCEAGFDSESDLIAHREPMVLGQDTKCTVCSIVFYNTSTLRAHVERVHNVKSLSSKLYVCNCCAAPLETLELYQAHREAHEPVPEAQRPAPVDRKARYAGGASTEQSGDDPQSEAPVVCVGCNVSFDNKSLYSKHLAVPAALKLNYCLECNISFENAAEQREHCEANHQTVQQSIQIVYVCSCCESVFSSFSLCTQHRKTHFPASDNSIKFYLHLTPRERSVRKRAAAASVPKESKKVQEKKPKAEKKVSADTDPDVSVTFDSQTIVSHEADLEPIAVTGRVYECGLCSLRLQNVSDLKEHIRTHSAFRVKCKECSLVMYSAQEYKKHQNFHWHPGMSFCCNTCQETCSDKESMLNHLWNQHHHTYECPHCGELFSKKTSLTLHVNSHPESKTFSCDKCDASFRTSGGLKRHTYSKHRDLRCPHCQKQMLTHRALNCHKTKCAQNPNRPVFTCGYCDKVFTSRSGYGEHLVIHTGRSNLICKQCGKITNSRRKLKEHINMAHTENSKPLYKCETCGVEFYFQKDLSRHAKKHHGGPVQVHSVCDFCGKELLTQQNAEVHRRKHTGEKPFKCTFCSRGFAEGTSLKRHMMSHTREFLYNCADCGKGYTNRKPFVRHREVAHEDFSMKEECEICIKTKLGAGRNLAYKLHRQQCHGEFRNKLPPLYLKDVMEDTI